MPDSSYCGVCGGYGDLRNHELYRRADGSITEVSNLPGLRANQHITDHPWEPQGLKVRLGRRKVR